jgi:hypothetical protein
MNRIWRLLQSTNPLKARIKTSPTFWKLIILKLQSKFKAKIFYVTSTENQDSNKNAEKHENGHLVLTHRLAAVTDRVCTQWCSMESRRAKINKLQIHHEPSLLIAHFTTVPLPTLSFSQKEEVCHFQEFGDMIVMECEYLVQSLHMNSHDHTN